MWKKRIEHGTRKIIWICKHGVEHPDPVSALDLSKRWEVRFAKLVAHKCDQCCEFDDFPGKSRICYGCGKILQNTRYFGKRKYKYHNKKCANKYKYQRGRQYQNRIAKRRYHIDKKYKEMKKRQNIVIARNWRTKNLANGKCTRCRGERDTGGKLCSKCYEQLKYSQILRGEL